MAPNEKVLLLAFYYPPENTSGVQRAVRFAKYLPSYGFDCRVVCSSHAGRCETYGNPVHVPDLAGIPGQLQKRERRAAWVQRRLLPYNEQLPWVPHAISAGRNMLRNDKFSAIISTSPPVGTHLAALQLKREYGVPWIADLRDPILGNPNRSRAWARPYDVILQRLIFKNADVIIGVTDFVVDEWKQMYPKWAHKMTLIWNGFDPEENFGPASQPAREFRVCSHIGVLYPQRHPYSILSAFSSLIEKGLIDPEKLKLNFIGPILDEQSFLAHGAVRVLREKGAILIRNENVPRAEAMREIAASDFLLLIDIVNLAQSGYTVPAKLYDYILTGRPILSLTQKDSPVDRILRDSGANVSTVYHGEEEAQILPKLLSFFETAVSTSPSAWFHNTFNGERQVAVLAKLIQERLTKAQITSDSRPQPHPIRVAPRP